MNEVIEYEGKKYICNNGKWYDESSYLEPEIGIQRNLNIKIAEEIEYSSKNIDVIIECADRFKNSENYDMAIKIYKKVIELTEEIEKIKNIIPKMTSCYRKINQPESAIELYKKMREEYGNELLTHPLLTSIAGAYGDLNDWENAKKYADKAYSKLNGNSTDELRNVYARINSKTKN